MTFLVLLLTLLLPLTAQAGSLPRHFCATLSSDQVVPPTTDPALALVQVRANYDASGIARTLDYQVHVSGGVSLTQMHVHCSAPGTNGPVVTFLAGLATGGMNVDQGTWVSANLDDTSITSTAAALTNPVTCKDANGKPAAVISTIDDLVQQMIAGNAYACIHSRANPAGSIRGTLGTHCGGR